MKVTTRLPLLCIGLALGGCASPPSAVAPRGAAAEREARAAPFLERARSFAAGGDLTRAEQYLNLALEVGADEREVVPLLLDVCVRDHRYRAGIQYAEHHLREHPRDAALRFVLGSLLLATGDLPRAREELERVVRMRPNYAEAHYTLAVLLRDELGNHLQADRHFREYLRLEPHGQHSEQAADSLLEVIP